MNRTLLQLTNAALGLVTVALGAMSLLFGAESPVYQGVEIPILPALDSNLRFFGGMGLGLGVILLWITPSIERQTRMFRAIWMCALAGGIGRIISFAAVGLPPTPMIVFTALEVPLVPLMLYWQWRVARESTSRAIDG